MSESVRNLSIIKSFRLFLFLFYGDGPSVPVFFRNDECIVAVLLCNWKYAQKEVRETGKLAHRATEIEKEEEEGERRGLISERTLLR